MFCADTMWRFLPVVCPVHRVFFQLGVILVAGPDSSRTAASAVRPGPVSPGPALKLNYDLLPPRQRTYWISQQNNAHQPSSCYWAPSR
jgi:hypothetical protein